MAFNQGHTPKGCSISGPSVYFNTHETGQALHSWSVICVKVVWSEAKTNVWGDDQCPLLQKIGNNGVTSLDHMKQLCMSEPGCNAIAFNSIGLKGGLRKCDTPIPEPTNHIGSAVKGYHIIDSTPDSG